jgi:hypothetical protein
MFASSSRCETTGPALEEVIERHITQRTWGRVHQLHVEVRDGRAHVRGCAPTYYVKQLAIQAVHDVDESLPVELEIDVYAVGLPPHD